MKKLLCVASFFCFVSFFSDLLAQTSVVAHANFPFPIEKTIIREYVYPTTVSYLTSDTCGYFVYADASLNTTFLPIDTNYNITDFVIDNDSVFFCGVNSKGNGFIGFFNIFDFFYGSNSYFVYNNVINSSLSDVSNLTKLVSYLDGNYVRHIVSIGKTMLGQYCVVNVTYNGATSMWNYETGEIPASSPETLVDIETTDDFVLTGGMYLNDPLNPNLVLRVCAKKNVFNSINSIQDYANELLDVTSQHSFCFDDVALLNYSCNEIYVAAFWKFHQDTGTVNPVIAQDPQGTYIGHYHLSQPKTIVNHLNSILVPHTYYSGGWRILGFSKLNVSSVSFNLLQEYEHTSSSDIRSFVYELSNVIVNSASPFSCVTTNDYFFYGIDGNYVLPNYLMNGISRADKTMLIYNMGQQGGNDCLKANDLKPVPIDMIETTHLAPYNVISKNIVFSTQKTNKNGINIMIDCSAKQSFR